ncbi:MAG: hypothetical protein FJY95_21145 [Candidatus Handelsmanbacteria bacterium]|nr:hypothetical protein [Candidatus Handelsmanbacteria bacterium]
MRRRAHLDPGDGQILFSRDVCGYVHVHLLTLINIDGPGEIGYPIGGPECFGNWPEFSPDGTSIAFTVWQGRQWDLWVMEADGSNKRQLTSIGGFPPPRAGPETAPGSPFPPITGSMSSMWTGPAA